MLRASAVARVDDPAVVRALLRLFAVEVKDRFLQVFEEPLGNVLEHQDVVRRGTGLAGVVPAALGDAPRREPHGQLLRVLPSEGGLVTSAISGVTVASTF
jgi:hypothetical protein